MTFQTAVFTVTDSLTHTIRTDTSNQELLRYSSFCFSSSVHISDHVRSMVWSWQDAYEHRQRILTLAMKRLQNDDSVLISGIRFKCCIFLVCKKNVYIQHKTQNTRFIFIYTFSLLEYNNTQSSKHCLLKTMPNTQSSKRCLLKTMANLQFIQLWIGWNRELEKPFLLVYPCNCFIKFLQFLNEPLDMLHRKIITELHRACSKAQCQQQQQQHSFILCSQL